MNVASKPESSTELTTAAEVYGKHLVGNDLLEVTSHVAVPNSPGDHVIVVAIRLHGTAKPLDVIHRAAEAIRELLTSK